jgi:hypothetical protein
MDFVEVDILRHAKQGGDSPKCICQAAYVKRD